MSYFYIFTSLLIVSLVSFVGIFFISLRDNVLKKITIYLVSLSAGTLLGGSFIHLLPEVLSENNFQISILYWVLFGIIIFFILEKIICWRHCHIPTSENHPHPVGIMNLVGDAFHNFLDGILVAGAFMVNTQMGIATTIAVITHEIPQEIGDFGVLIHAGFNRTRALFYNFLSALSAMIGALVTIFLGKYVEDVNFYIISLAAGGFIYIATADLIPELKKEVKPFGSIAQLAVILIGIVIMAGLKMLFE
ncbi:hypothetical protein A2331_03010 [Candidatus Falkowbacteria bacterium RIFOXYB2_FULL_34_18]|uniref:ZIP family metal transporter n=1 Tax=Candidatus Falkowbacteria bacterium RIFOXYD2_FULL_34_120 TaxID=1798007 RepID=A0A1F5TML5_9BACT|nr:MAG: hypothetical protein A2331_03010 [Candidatus Falkowbacteria bacterium RIFOXYB2_FULL_34_18]OGF28322.1 MAG: hypothetical protein A2500_02930 [Candidatus Falkowbacteria bacterium RIFOXYC12_FULL_34_55]OGF37959.1 MAG: hypothetical protein A2466_06155 [Candidatus Falkowbacteria bacterium RIFOXYC2_FULL_34_220]OGF39677.1 MAG: hypothetical protein A2515_07450 [Candidatus Falkowbacteria bacterium RIFOXYD12_FULL_34_57]OGF40116.1 MAG: hypothetical protein A2531_05145 [Candidatus Falkowbacteria bact